MEITSVHLAVALILIAVSFATGPKIFGEVVTLVLFGTSWLIYAMVFNADVATIYVGGVFGGVTFGYLNYHMIEAAKSTDLIVKFLPTLPSTEATDRIKNSFPESVGLIAMIIGGYLIANVITILYLRDPLHAVIIANGTLLSINAVAVSASKNPETNNYQIPSVIASMFAGFIAIPLCITVVETYIAA